MERTGGMENAHETMAADWATVQARFPHRLGRHRTPPVTLHRQDRCTLRTRRHGWNLEHPLRSRWEETDRRAFVVLRRAVHVRRIPRSRSPDSAFNFTGIRNEEFRRLGGTARQREAGRYRITHVPAPVRTRDRRIGLREPVLPRYERIAFEKPKVAPPGQPLAALVCRLPARGSSDSAKGRVPCGFLVQFSLQSNRPGSRAIAQAIAPAQAYRNSP